MTGEHHFTNRGEQATIRAVVIGQDQLVLIQALHDLEERFQNARIIHVRCLVTHLIVDLRKCGATQAAFVVAEINQH